MRAIREDNKKNNKENRLKLKSIGLSIALHIAVVALVVGVGKSEEGMGVSNEETTTMKAVLWVSTGAKEKQKEPQVVPPVKVDKKSIAEEPLPKSQVLNSADVSKVNDNVVKIPKEIKKVEDDPWLDELLALEPLEQPYDGESKNANLPTKEDEALEPIVESVMDVIDLDIDSPTLLVAEALGEDVSDIVEQQPISETQKEETHTDNNEVQEEAYVDPYFKYRLDVAKHIQRKWKANSVLSGLMCEIDISIMRDGTILMLHSLNGNRDVCESAKMAIKRIRKLPSTPSDEVYNKLKRMSVRLTVN